MTGAEVAGAGDVRRNLVALRALNRAANANGQMPLVLPHSHGRGKGASLQIGWRRR